VRGGLDRRDGRTRGSGAPAGRRGCTRNEGSRGWPWPASYPGCRPKSMNEAGSASDTGSRCSAGFVWLPGRLARGRRRGAELCRSWSYAGCGDSVWVRIVPGGSVRAVQWTGGERQGMLRSEGTGTRRLQDAQQRDEGREGQGGNAMERPRQGVARLCCKLFCRRNLCVDRGGRKWLRFVEACPGSRGTGTFVVQRDRG